MARIVYWLVILVLGVLTVAAASFAASHGYTALGMVGLLAALVCLAVLLSYGLSMRDRGPVVPR